MELKIKILFVLKVMINIIIIIIIVFTNKKFIKLKLINQIGPNPKYPVKYFINL